MTSYAYRIYGITGAAGPHVMGFDSNGLATDSLAEVWDGPASTRCRWRVHKNGDVILGPRTAADLSTTATDGFLLIRSGNGAPTGTPSNAANGVAPLYYDRANDRLYIYNTAWVSVALT